MSQLRNPYDLWRSDSALRNQQQEYRLAEEDEEIQNTNDDATISRLSAVTAGYFVDQYVKHFVPLRSQNIKRSPLINRGTYLRCKVIDQYVSDYCLKHKDVQIVSLGAGFDTRYFRLKDAGVQFKKYFEVDFERIIMKKMSTLRKHAMNFGVKILPNGEVEDGSYKLLMGDLRDWDAVVPSLSKAGFQKDLPALILAECVFVYMPIKCSDSILKWASSELTTSALVVYENMTLDDQFGQIMVDNIRSRGMKLEGVDACRNVEQIRARYEESKFYVQIQDLAQFYQTMVMQNEEEFTRLNKVQMMDEMEELLLLLKHYYVLYAEHE
ncbi:hypothetical protein MIR68_000723 [Amoeboaphelidium protococcarum]|nr:hypothetical protein MIR68_000723 [Amoeboaphelidium protococcarum]